MKSLETIYELVKVLVCIFEVYLMFDFFSAFFTIKKTLRNLYAKVGIVLGFSACVFMVNCLGSSTVNIFFMIALYFLLILFVFEGSLLKKVLYSVIAYIIMGSSEFIFALILATPSQQALSEIRLNPFFLTVALIGIKLLTFILFNLAKRLSPNSNSRMDLKNFVLYTVLPVSWLGIIVAIAYLNVDFDAPGPAKILLVIFSILGIVGNMLIYYAFETYFSTVEKIQQQDLMITKLEMEAKYYEQIDKMNQEHAALLHDVHHYLKTIGEVAAESEDEDVLKILSELQIRVSEKETVIYCNNRLLNAILNEKRKGAMEAGTDLKIKVEPCFSIEQIKEIDLIAIIGNLLDNAIEASAKCESGYVAVCMFMQNDNRYSVMKVENNYTGKIVLEDEKIITTKKDKKRHGIGIQSVSGIVDKYNGSLQNFYENNVFTTIVLLPVNN